MICLHINLKVHVACNLSFVVKNEGVLKVTGNHVHFKSGSVLKMVLGKDVETTVHKPFNSSNCYDCGCMSRSVIDCKLFSILTSRASCFKWKFVVVHLCWMLYKQAPAPRKARMPR